MTKPTYSFEFFPPKSLEASFRLWDTVHALAPLNPEFVSVTYGAGGTTRELTHEAVTTIGKTTGLRVAAHLTCVNATREETLAIAETYAAAGVTDIVALRGDMPGGAPFAAHPDGFADSVELIAALAATGHFNVMCGAYPNLHPEAGSMEANVEYLKRKIDAGASRAITQFFFDTDSFLRFRDACAAAGIGVPVVPGILPIENWTGVKKFAGSCGLDVPDWLDRGFTAAIRDDRAELLATAICSEMCTRLIDHGVEHLHFYTLNKPHLSRDVIHGLGLAPQARLQDVA